MKDESCDNFLGLLSEYLSHMLALKDACKKYHALTAKRLPQADPIP